MGTFSLKQVLNFTINSNFASRYLYAERDVLKSINIQRIKVFEARSKQLPQRIQTEKFRIVSSSYPQYKPYISLKGKHSQRQMKIKHQYEIILEMDKLSVNTKNWVTYVGSHKEIPKHVPQNLIKSVKHETLEKWKKEALKKFKTKKDQAEYVRKLREKQHKKGFYLDAGDYISRKLGINLDWRYRFEWVFFKFSHLYGKLKANGPAKTTNPGNIPALTKHHIRVLEILLQRGVLKDD